jgi:hypothetical protein
MIVLYLAFGHNQHIHQQVTFSALTMLSWKNPAIKIVIFTDVPEHYELLHGLVELRVPGAGRLAEWKGPHDYFFRVKFKALQDLLEGNPGQHLLYLDGDTFTFGDPTGLIDAMREGANLMHAREGKLSNLPTKTERRMWKMCAGRAFGGIQVTQDSTMYNAGVIGLHREGAASVIERGLLACDEMLTYGVPERLVEQLSFSLALTERTTIRAANHIIGHYWGNKEEWNGVISDFLLRHLLQSSSRESLLESVRKIDFQVVPVYRKQSNTHRKLTRWVDNNFFNERHAFVSTEEGPDSDLSDR